MTEYIFTIKGVDFVIDDETKNAIELFEQGLVYRYAIKELLIAELKKQKMSEKTRIPLKSLVELILRMYKENKYVTKKKCYRCMIMLQFYSVDKPDKPYSPFFESRTWHYYCKEISDDKKVDILNSLENEAWYQLITVPSIIDAFRKDAIKVEIGEEECVSIDEDEVDGEVCTTYRYMKNYRKDYEFEHERIEYDIKAIEDKIKALTITDFTGAPITKQEIIRWIKIGYWERLFRTLYRVWKEATNYLGTNFWWG